MEDLRNSLFREQSLSIGESRAKATELGFEIFRHGGTEV